MEEEKLFCIYRTRSPDRTTPTMVQPSWNVMAHGDAWEGKWRGNWRMEWVASTLHTTSEHGVSSITTADAHTSAASSRLNWRPRRFKRTRPFRRKKKTSFCACAITFQTQSTLVHQKEAVVAYFKIGSRNLSGGTEDENEKPQSE